MQRPLTLMTLAASLIATTAIARSPDTYQASQPVAAAPVHALSLGEALKEIAVAHSPHKGYKLLAWVHHQVEKQLERSSRWTGQ